jgi:hypothetical protein
VNPIASASSGTVCGVHPAFDTNIVGDGTEPQLDIPPVRCSS